HRPSNGDESGHHYSKHRRHSLRRLWTAAGLDALHSIEPVPRHSGGPAAVSVSPEKSREHLCPIHIRTSGADHRFHQQFTFVHADTDHKDRTVSGNNG